jgi:hypothetical protein
MSNEIHNKLLQMFITFNRSKLIGEIPKNPTRDTKIKFKCECGDEDQKGAGRINISGPICKKCMNKIGREKQLKTLKEKHGDHINNPMDIPGMKDTIKNAISKKYGPDKQKEIGINLAKKRKEHWDKESIKWIAIKNANKMKCNTCNIEKTLDNFQKGNREYESWHYKCYECRNIKRRNNAHEKSKSISFEEVFKQLLYGAKQRHIKKNFIDEFNLTTEYLLKVYNEQGGKCYISGRKLLTEINNIDRVSIDRIDSQKGYIQGNIGLACWGANNIKQDLSMDEFKCIIRDIYHNICI